MFLSNKYSKWYFELVAKGQASPVDGYGEWHHIIPKSLGGSNEKVNLVRFSAREHFVAHRLLVRMLVGKAKQKMVYALKRTVSSKKHVPNSRVFAQIREEYAKTTSAVLTGRKLSQAHRENISRGQKGLPKNDSFKKQMSDRLRDINRDSERREKISASLKGHTMSEETRRKISETRKRKHAEKQLLRSSRSE